MLPKSVGARTFRVGVWKITSARESYLRDLYVTFQKNPKSINRLYQVADPGFSRDRDINSKGGCADLIFHNVFVESSMKMKEFGPRGMRASLSPLGSANGLSVLLPRAF